MQMRRYLRQLSETVTPWLYYHGSQNQIERFTDNLVYLTDNPDEALMYARNAHRPGQRTQSPVVHKIAAKPAPVLDIDDEEFDEALMDGEIDAHIAMRAMKAKPRYRYLSFTHPGMIEDEITVLVSLYPQQDLSVIGTE